MKTFFKKSLIVLSVIFAGSAFACGDGGGDCNGELQVNLPKTLPSAMGPINEIQIGGWTKSTTDSASGATGVGDIVKSQALSWGNSENTIDGEGKLSVSGNGENCYDCQNKAVNLGVKMTNTAGAAGQNLTTSEQGQALSQTSTMTGARTMNYIGAFLKLTE